MYGIITLPENSKDGRCGSCSSCDGSDRKCGRVLNGVREKVRYRDTRKKVLKILLIRERIQELGPESVACVFSTTSCFAPRAHDNLPEIAKICKQADIPHIG